MSRAAAVPGMRDALGHADGTLAGMLADLIQDFASSLDVEETLQHAVERIIVHLQAEAASIFLLDDAHRTLECRRCAGPIDISGLTLPADEGIVGEAVGSGRVQIISDVGRSERFAANIDRHTGFVTRSILCAPLAVRGRAIGALEVLNKRGGDGCFGEADVHLATTVAAAAALAIHNARMAAAMLGQERVRKELEMAREIQLRLLPPDPAGTLPIRGLNRPAREVSGDSYDFMRLPDGRIYFSIADVAGKGMNAALSMAKTTSLLRCLARTIADPGQLLAMVNDELCDTSSHGMFVTIVAGFIEPGEQRLTFANGGHLPPVLRRRDGGHARFVARVPPLGIEPGLAFPVDTLLLGDGGVYLFTDGLTEARDASGVELGVEGLLRLLDDVAALPPDARLPAIVSALAAQGRRSDDDLTMLLIEFDCDG